MNLNGLRDQAYEIAKSKGWHDQYRSNSHYLCLVISELMETVNADRKNRHANINRYEAEYIYVKLKGSDDFIEKFEKYIKNTVEDELTDACIRLLDLAGLREVDLSELYFMDDIKGKVELTEFMYAMSSLLTNPDLGLNSKIQLSLVSLINY